VNTTERECLDAACAGDREAFDMLCQTYRQDIYALCFRFLSDREDTQDIVQETFSRAWQYIQTYRREASFRTWLWEIGRNLCLNHLRARKSQLNQKTVALDTEHQQVLDVPDARPTPEEILLDAAHLSHLRQEIRVYAAEKKWEATDWELFLFRIEKNIAYADFAKMHGRDEAYWRNRWRDKIKPVLERVRNKFLYPSD
jgi:RNA polymerase sigma-70 factor (ECF subfamily)